MLIEVLKQLLKKYGIEEEKSESFINDFESGMCINVEAHGEGYELPNDEVWTINDATRYSKEDIQFLMKARVHRTHRAFFNRYNVRSIEELDHLVKGNQEALLERYNMNSFDELDKLIEKGRAYKIMQWSLKGHIRICEYLFEQMDKPKENILKK